MGRVVVCERQLFISQGQRQIGGEYVVIVLGWGKSNCCLGIWPPDSIVGAKVMSVSCHPLPRYVSGRGIYIFIYIHTASIPNPDSSLAWVKLC